MLTRPVAVWIANAAAGLSGNSGHVNGQAKTADCSRQTIECSPDKRHEFTVTAMGRSLNQILVLLAIVSRPVAQPLLVVHILR